MPHEAHGRISTKSKKVASRTEESFKSHIRTDHEENNTPLKRKREDNIIEIETPTKLFKQIQRQQMTTPIQNKNNIRIENNKMTTPGSKRKLDV